MPRTRLAPLLVALLLGAAFARAQAGDPPPAPPGAVKVLEHDVTVRLLPGAHRLVAQDVLLVEAGGSGGRLDLRLALDLVPTAPVTDGDGKALECRQGPADGMYCLRGIPVPAGRSTVVVRYGGVVFDAVQQAGDLTWVAGDGTKGLVSEKGVYLASSSRWIPVPADAGLARFHVKAYVPEPFHVVTQGTVPNRASVRSPGGPEAGSYAAPDALPATWDGATTTWNVLEARAVLPTDGLQLVAGPYKTKARTAEGVTFATWFYEAEAAEADLWLDAMEGVVKRYAEVLGPYPHPKFDIVENFFQTGWGMPSFTLLGDQVIQYVTAGAKRSGGKIPPGYLDHEYVHGWYGNGLFVDYATGNWCEALTTYCSNYLAKELESVGEARAHRRGVLEKFSMRVKGAKDVPVRAFREKTEDTDNDIGYGKGSLIFHQIRRQVGDEVFWTTLRAFTQQRVGTVVSWDDFFAAFDAASGISVSAHVKPYLERPGLPGLTVDSSSVMSGAGGGKHVVGLKLRQALPAGEKPFPLFVPVRLEGLPDEERDHEIDLSAGEAVWTVVVSGPPRAITLDPDHHVLRRIAESDLPPCLERTLAGGAGVVVLAGGGEKTFQPLAEQMAATKGFRVVGPEFPLAEHQGPAVVLAVAPAGTSLSVGGSTYDDPAIGVLRSTADGGVLRTTFTALSEEAASRASRLPFYGWDPWVVFRSGRPIARDPRNAERPSTRLVPGLVPHEAADRVKADIAKLCSPEFEGRRPGTPGHEKAWLWIAGQSGSWSGMSGNVGFPVRVPRLLSSRDLVVVQGESRETWAKAFWPFAFGSATEGTHEAKAPEVVVIPWNDPSVAKLHADAAARAPGVLVYALSEKAMAGLAPWLDHAGDLTPPTEAELTKPGRDGKPRARPVPEPWISGRRQRGGDLEWVHSVVLAVDESTGTKLEKSLEAGAALHLEVKRAPDLEGTVVYTSRTGSIPPRGHPVVLLMAHYDSFGPQPGGLWVGADDNATGVACLLEVLRSLPPTDDLAPKPCDVMVAFTDAEEWGLLGARALLANLRERFDVRAVINVDSIGRAVSKPTHILGLSKHPALARLVRNALETDGIVVGPDIDAYGYEHGSDHWPFHEAGIPAITLWASDYGVMNTAEDTPEKVENEGVANVAAALARLLREDLGALTQVRPPAPPR